MAAAEFNWEDPLDLESQLTDEERMIRDAARAFAQDKLLPRVKSAFRDERFDREIMNEMGEMGFLGVMTSTEFGGSGLGHEARHGAAQPLGVLLRDRHGYAQRARRLEQDGAARFRLRPAGHGGQKPLLHVDEEQGGFGGFDEHRAIPWTVR